VPPLNCWPKTSSLPATGRSPDQTLHISGVIAFRSSARTQVHNWRSILQIVQPETLLPWHREGFRLFWRWKLRRRGPVRRRAAQTIDLIQRLARDASRPTLGRRAYPRRVAQAWHSRRQTHHSEISARRAFIDNMDPLVHLLEYGPYLGLWLVPVILCSFRRSMRLSSSIWVHARSSVLTYGNRPTLVAPFERRETRFDDVTQVWTPVIAAARCAADALHALRGAQANAICERFPGSLAQYLDVLGSGDRQLVRVLKRLGYFNRARLTGLAQQTPVKHIGQAR
jgi:hypothetical protein